MPNMLDEHSKLLIKDLLRHLSGFEENTAGFKLLEKDVLRNVQMADSLYYSSKGDIDAIIESLGNKFMLHGLAIQAKQVQHLYKKLVPATLKRQELAIRLNVIKFLLGVSQSPTNNFYKHQVSSNPRFEKGDAEEIADWPSYLQEGIPRWSPPPPDDSDTWSDISEGTALDENADCQSSFNNKAVLETQCEEQDILVLYQRSKTNLTKCVQSVWFNSDQVIIKPSSQDREANIAILWHNFIKEKTMGLFPAQNPHILTEYRVMREIIWQLYHAHTSSCFSLSGNKIMPTENVTISSVQNKALQVMLHNVMPFIQWLEVLRDFNDSLINSKNGSAVVPPDTYRSYNFAVQSILSPIFESLRLIEDAIKSQESTNTLLTLANQLRCLFNTVKALYNIHNKVILDFNTYSPFECSTTLLWRLRKGLLYASSKLEHDLLLALYLHSLYKYFNIIHSWLSRDEFQDQIGEFLISDENPKDPHVLFKQSYYTFDTGENVEQQTSRKTKKGEQDWHMEFIVKETKLGLSDGIFDIICTRVLQIGKNIHLLWLLGKLHLIPELTGKSHETLYKAFIRRVLERIEDIFQQGNKMMEQSDAKESTSDTTTFVFPAICPDGCKYFTEMDKLENLVDTKDGFLLKAFESFFVKKPEYKCDVPDKDLYERISEVTTDFFPAYEIVEDVFITILKERYVISGIVVKNVLINDYNLEKQFLFLKHIYLFEEDLIFPVYRHIFEELDTGSIWINRFQLTSHLQDIIMDIYPNFYDECILDIADSCKHTNDPLKACRMVNINYKIPWPINIILRDEHLLMYKELFQFILMIKWALYTLNHMYFGELKPIMIAVKGNKAMKNQIKQLKILRFGLVNIFSSIQHYVLGHIFTKHMLNFQKAFAEAYDLQSLILAHTDFIKPLHKECLLLRDHNNSDHGIYLLLYVVTELRQMWRNLPDIKHENLTRCVNWYLKCQQSIDPILNPTSYYNFMSNR